MGFLVSQFMKYHDYRKTLWSHLNLIFLVSNSENKNVVVDEDENVDDVSSSLLLSLLSKVVTVVSTAQFENASFVFSPPSLAITITPVIFCNITPADMSYLTFHSACF